ncbi:site-specific integrase [Paenibacillus radicis (ex Gao et al. 2016)]|uniref:Tyr recombinase domain-containing protein n=1 Tax=Paenibacillus radicis (ex Gao et al. 2016) TaxID=1737354 RepID=A0A917M1L8_9BACL|nr:site-specific integrase [Paenibacillus radicis (ex Gao et al. 2016)]GGG73398.1 hypothetical protein GCM10010918_31840 [Paenibacillus radicis (ex Gao et al. 2016)]
MQYRDIYEDNGLVVCKEKGKPAYAKYKKEAEVPHITFHDLRHTHASLLLQQNVHPKIVSERLGHSSITMTLDTYSHLLPNMQDVASNSLAKTLFHASTVNEQRCEYLVIAW